MSVAEEFSRTRFDALETAITDGDAEHVRKLAASAQMEYVPVHDGLRDTVGAALSYAVDMTSPEEGEAIGRRAIARIMAGGDAPQYGQIDLRARIRAIAAGWHWHVTGFTVVEDEDKVTFRLAPCGSGMRLETEGRYDGAQGWHRSVAPSPSTFMQRGFPLYSNHCAEMTRAGLISGSGAFLVEGWTPERNRGACFQHTFKRMEAVPAEFYRRVGLEPPSPVETTPVVQLFSELELVDLATHPLDRAATAVESGDTDAALAALAESREAWGTAMHGAYLRWIAELWEEICRVCGEREREPLLEATAPELFGHIRGGDAHSWASFWSMHLALRGISEGPDGATTFEVEPAALLSDVSLVTPEILCRCVRRGAEGRCWPAIGHIESDGVTIRHTVDMTQQS